MKVEIILFSLLFLILSSCQTSKAIKTINAENNLSDEEIIRLSEDCEYINMKLKKELKRWKEPKKQKRRGNTIRQDRKNWIKEMTIAHGPSWAKENKPKRRTRPKNKIKVKKQKNSDKEIPFVKNDLLVELLVSTPCLKGNTKEQIIDIFGEPGRWIGVNIPPSEFVDYLFQYEDNNYYKLTFVFEDNQLISTYKSPITLITISCPAPRW